MSDDSLTYVGILEDELHVDPRTRSAVVSEVRTHLEERSAELERAGLGAQAAEQRAIHDFGDPHTLAQGFYSVHSTASTRDVLMGVMPHLGIAAMFRFHLWVELFWVAVAVSMALTAVVVAWRRGLPRWTAPWLGYALVLPAMTWVLAVAAVGYGVWSLLTGTPAPLSVAMYLAMALWIPFSTVIIIAIALRTVSYDWLVVSLASLPLPFLSAWLFLLPWHEGVFIPNQVRGLETDTATALVFLGLAVFTALFMRVGRRGWRLLIILALAPPLIGLAAIRYQATPDSGAVIIAIVLTALFLVSPVLLDHAGRTGSRRRRAT